MAVVHPDTYARLRRLAVHHLPRLIPVVVLALAVVVHPVAAQSSADLAITMVPSETHLRFRESMTVTITVTNLGPDPATGVRLETGESDSIDPGAVSCDEGGGPCEIDSLDAGESVTATWTVTALGNCCSEKRGRGLIIASVFGDAATVDPNLDNNATRLQIKFIGPFPHQEAAMFIVAADPGPQRGVSWAAR